MSAYFLDTSSLVKLYYTEPDSAALRGQIHYTDTLVIAELTHGEIHSAVARKVRRGEISSSIAAAGLHFFALAWPSFTRISLTNTVLSHASQLVQRHDRLALRSLDAIQLAAALAAGPLDGFFTHDERLRQAALAEGLPVR